MALLFEEGQQVLDRRWRRVSSAILSSRSGTPSRSQTSWSSAAIDSLRKLLIQTIRLMPPSAEMNFLLVR